MSLWDNWGDGRGCDIGHWHADTRGLRWGLPEVVGTVQQVHCSRRRLLRRGLEFHECTINKSAHTKKFGNLFNDPRIFKMNAVFLPFKRHFKKPIDPLSIIMACQWGYCLPRFLGIEKNAGKEDSCLSNVNNSSRDSNTVSWIFCCAEYW